MANNLVNELYASNKNLNEKFRELQKNVSQEHCEFKKELKLLNENVSKIIEQNQKILNIFESNQNKSLLNQFNLSNKKINSTLDVIFNEKDITNILE